jgi:hypothetical protein
VLFPRNPLPALDFGALGTVEDEEGEKRCTHEARATKKQSSQFRILAFSSVGCMKEPDRCIDANTKTPEIGRIPLESVDDGSVGERPQFSRGSKNL